MKQAKRLNNLGDYVFSRLDKLRVQIEKESGRKVLNFGPGTPDIKPSNLYINKLSEYIKDENAHIYPGYKANEEFSNALIYWYKKRFGVTLEKDELLPLNGAKDGISHIPLAFLDKGDEILVPDPGYPAFSSPALLVDAKIVSYDLTEENNFKPDLKQINKLISKRTKFIYINFPSNPTGQVIKLDELEKIVNFVKQKNIFIIYDNAYSEITFDNYKAPSILEIKGAKEIALEIGSFSKTFSLAGFRMGWIVGNNEVIKSFAQLKSQMDSGMSLPLQNLGAFTLTHSDKKWNKNMLDDYEKRRNIISKKLKKLGLSFTLPKGALYIWAKIPDYEKSSDEFCMRLLREKQILLTPGTAFGKNGERYVRISICVNIIHIDKYF